MEGSVWFRLSVFAFFILLVNLFRFLKRFVKVVKKAFRNLLPLYLVSSLKLSTMGFVSDEYRGRAIGGQVCQNLVTAGRSHRSPLFQEETPSCAYFSSGLSAAPILSVLSMCRKKSSDLVKNNWDFLAQSAVDNLFITRPFEAKRG
jgi:hypothetical protein